MRWLSSAIGRNTFWLTSVALIGTKLAESALAQVTMSGCTPKVSLPQ